MDFFYRVISKTLSFSLSIYLIIRYFFFTYILKKFSILKDYDKKNLAYNQELKKNALEKNLDFKSWLFDLKKFNINLSNFSGDRFNLLINHFHSFDYINKNEAKVLIIGPRTEGDIYRARIFGFKKENISAIDLHSYSPNITLGDMHAIPYKDNSFDIIFSCWTLVYSDNNKKAVDEIIRVSRNNCLVGIGYSHINHGFQKISISNSDILFSYFGRHLKDVHFKYHPNDESSRTSLGKRAIYVLRLSKEINEN